MLIHKNKSFDYGITVIQLKHRDKEKGDGDACGVSCEHCNSAMLDISAGKRSYRHSGARADSRPLEFE